MPNIISCLVNAFNSLFWNFLFILLGSRFSFQPRAHIECRCHPYGSLSKTCDKFTGKCFCRENVTGRACDKCVDGFWNLQADHGCESCQCNVIGSVDRNCSSYTGQCNCKPGVGGRACDVCLDGFYGLSTTGCKRKFIETNLKQQVNLLCSLLIFPHL